MALYVLIALSFTFVGFFAGLIVGFQAGEMEREYE
jgi:hypothetical protein